MPNKNRLNRNHKEVVEGVEASPNAGFQFINLSNSARLGKEARTTVKRHVRKYSITRRRAHLDPLPPPDLAQPAADESHVPKSLGLQNELPERPVPTSSQEPEAQQADHVQHPSPNSSSSGSSVTIYTSHTSIIQTGLSITRFDPFESLPMLYNNENMRSAHHCWTVTAKDSICHRGRGVWFEFMKYDHTICNFVLYHLSLSYSITRGVVFPSADVHRAEALSLLRQKIKHVEHDELQRVQSLNGLYSEVDIHFKALRRIVDMSGGLKKENFSPAVLNILYWAYDSAECVVDGEQKFLHFGSRTPDFQDCLCICLIIKGNLWRSLSSRSITSTGPSILKFVMERLEGGFTPLLSNRLLTNQLIWALVIGTVASAPADPNHAWFSNQLVEVCYAAQIRSWPEIYAILNQNYWSPSWDQPRGSLWMELEANLQIKMQTTVVVTQSN